MTGTPANSGKSHTGCVADLDVTSLFSVFRHLASKHNHVKRRQNRSGQAKAKKTKGAIGKEHVELQHLRP